jgi:hypothetical protein
LRPPSLGDIAGCSAHCPVHQPEASGPLSIKPLIAMPFAIALPMPGIRKGHVMSKRENDANNIFRPSDSPLTEYEKEQIALRKNLERLKAERLAREAANSKND